MSSDTRNRQSPGQGPYWVAVAGLVILVGIVGFALVRRHEPAAPPPEESSADASIPPSTIVATVPEVLSSKTRIIVERYRCVCGCNDPLSTCTCSNTPGSHDMKAHLQALVAEGKTSREIDQEMIDKYGPQVLLSAPADGGS